MGVVLGYIVFRIDPSGPRYVSKARFTIAGGKPVQHEAIIASSNHIFQVLENNKLEKLRFLEFANSSLDCARHISENLIVQFDGEAYSIEFGCNDSQESRVVVSNLLKDYLDQLDEQSKPKRAIEEALEDAKVRLETIEAEMESAKPTDPDWQNRIKERDQIRDLYQAIVDKKLEIESNSEPEFEWSVLEEPTIGVRDRLSLSFCLIVGGLGGLPIGLFLAFCTGLIWFLVRRTNAG